MGCINKNLKDNQRLIQDFSETRVNQLFDEYFPKENPSYSEFISNPNVKEALGIIPISKVKSEIGKAFGKEISSRELKILKKSISDINDKLLGHSYKLFNIKQKGESDNYSWGLRKINSNINIQAKIDRLKQRINTGKQIRNLEDNQFNFPDINQTIKPGVEELFNENPELANSVYAALGFKSNLKTSLGKELEYKDPYVPINRLKYFKQYQVLDENNNDIGSVIIEYRGDKSVILHPKLTIKGKGYGKDLYKFISNKFNVTIEEWNEGGISNSSAAKKMWDSLEREGYAERIFDEESGDNFRILKYNNNITPQQKQQATFMFSKFLDVYLQDFEQVERVLKEENVIEKDCTGGIKAENGLQTNFTRGGKWKIYEIFEGKSHKQGGIDINIKNNQISFTNKNGSIKAKYGLVISKENKL